MRVTKEATEESWSVVKRANLCVSLEYSESHRKEGTSNLEHVPRCKHRTRRTNVRERQRMCVNAVNLLFGERSNVSVPL
jgi:hypothetical protein